MCRYAIAVVGMCGAGKSTVTEYLQSKGWTAIRFGQVTIDELARLGLPVNEANERRVREELRAKRGMAVYVEILRVPLQEALLRGPVVIDGLYSWSEYRNLKHLLGERLIMIAIVATRSIRHGRLDARATRPLSTEEAEVRDAAEVEHLEKGGPIAIADFTIVNDGSLAGLHSHLDSILTRLQPVSWDRQYDKHDVEV
jgi:dephospho-CoA kinase